jgi:hypothetical protein
MANRLDALSPITVGWAAALWAVLWSPSTRTAGWVYRELYKTLVVEADQARIILEADGEHVAAHYLRNGRQRRLAMRICRKRAS